jgi:AraC-like DNA-binding protein
MRTTSHAKPPQEWVSYHKRPDVYGIEFIHANFVRHRFSRHVHDYYVLGFIEDGLQTFDYRGEKHRTAPSGIIILNPDEPHTGEAATPVGFTYKAMYPSVELLSHITEDITGKPNGLPYFPQPIVYDTDIARRLLNLHQVLVSEGTGSLSGESAFLDVFAVLISRYADAKLRTLTIRSERSAVQRVRDYIEANYDQNISLNELAQLVAFSPYYLARTFTTVTGIPPHAYLESVRIRHAQRLLVQGIPIADVALKTGFPHQSHFTTRFRLAVGVTPGRYIQETSVMNAARKERKITQDNDSPSA